MCIVGLRESGMLVCTDGRGTFQGCEMDANQFYGIELQEGGNPLVTESKIHSNKQGSVHVYDDGLGTFQDCEIEEAA
ncbi:hypothetical protein CYMTET_26335 [Cymbomonas tetramitiformis]|uniref:Right handed beta helix domain-containing protein n=1 Tax=Cymbomonas tetramitiformis TaxID=36881 RepID=A0AAE0FSQ3_9CHLO|nr:hypothetical protein CYMTET_26335 [Cymbomonas tetramitiformis]